MPTAKKAKKAMGVGGRRRQRRLPTETLGVGARVRIFIPDEVEGCANIGDVDDATSGAAAVKGEED